MNIDPDLFKLGVSLVLGAMIGFEREVSDKAAGLRTNILICVGGTLFAILSTKFAGATNDPTRMAAQIVSGIGFLGAGAIMREGDRVTGLTTAATIWIVAAIGVAVGFHQFDLACWTTVSVLVVQAVFTRLDALIDDWRERHTFRIVSKLNDEAIEEIKTVFREAGVEVLRRKLMKKGGHFYSEWYTTGPREAQKNLMKKLLDSPNVTEVVY
jgi:putative Mg2+ transporter-C (MgtC) family protein